MPYGGLGLCLSDGTMAHLFYTSSGDYGLSTTDLDPGVPLAASPVDGQCSLSYTCPLRLMQSIVISPEQREGACS